MAEKGKILGFIYNVKVPEATRGGKSKVDWKGTLKAFYDAFLKDNSKDSAEIKLEGIVKNSTALLNLRNSLKTSELKGKVEVRASTHTENKIREVDHVYLVISDAEKKVGQKKAR